MKKESETQVLVVGAGVTGTAIARELSKYKVAVVVVEKEKYAPRTLERAPRYKLAGAVYHENKERRGPIRWKVESILKVEPGSPGRMGTSNHLM